MPCSASSRSRSWTAIRPPKAFVTLRIERIEVLIRCLLWCWIGFVLQFRGFREQFAFGAKLFMQLLAASGLGQEALGASQHHDDQQRSVDQQAVLRELTQEFRQSDQNQSSNENTGQTSHATNNNERQHIYGNQQFEAVWVDGSNLRGENGTAKSGECCTGCKSHQFGGDQMNAHRLSNVFVLAQCLPCPANA